MPVSRDFGWHANRRHSRISDAFRHGGPRADGNGGRPARPNPCRTARRVHRKRRGMKRPLMNHDIQIVKVSGSLYDLPDLKTRLLQWVAQQPAKRIILVPGGGSAAHVIRSLDRTHHLGEEAAHWLALRMVQVNGCFLRELLPQAQIVRSATEDVQLGILDAYAFARADEAHAGHLPHIWDATSDSLAVRVAVSAQAGELVLLKSVSWDNDDWQSAAHAGLVDRYFPEASRQAERLAVRVVNLRTEKLPNS